MKVRREYMAAGSVLAGMAVAMTGNAWIEWPVFVVAGSVFIRYIVTYRVIDRRRSQ